MTKKVLTGTFLFFKNMNTLLEGFRAFAQEHQLLEDKGTVLIAVSGGLDSVVMAHVLYASRVRMAVAHVNFGLRGEESDGDEAFVAEWAKARGLPFHVTRFDTEGLCAEMKASTQMTARQLRYAWFDQLADEHGYSRIATAHHSNDVLETLLLNLSKGTGISGFHGILPKSGRLIRPMLFASRGDLEKYAHENGIRWREDRSNATTDYQRNLLRHEVVPVLKRINPNIEQSVLETAERLRLTEQFFMAQVEHIRQDVMKQRGSRWQISLEKLRQVPHFEIILYYLLKPFGFPYRRVKQVTRYLLGLSGRQAYSATHRLVHDRGSLWIAPKEEPRIAPLALEIGETTASKGDVFCIEILPKSAVTGYSADAWEGEFDADKLQFPLHVRHWQEGDRFHPLGMKGTKKLSDFFVDRKCSILEKRIL